MASKSMALERANTSQRRKGQINIPESTLGRKFAGSRKHDEIADSDDPLAVAISTDVAETPTENGREP
jgi:hypothetical protein